MKTRKGLLAGVGFLVCVGGCSAQRPVIYPNSKAQAAGQAAVDRDVSDCMRLADQYVSTSSQTEQKTKSVAGSTAVGAGSGAAIGAVGGAITGNAGQSAAVGAATGATAGFIHGILGSWGSSQPDPVYANFVDRCLRDRGYETIGWQ